MKNILIGGAWPYANGSLHIGHLAALLPGDVLARYYRTKGDRVIYISGSDCHGTPVTIRAKQEGVSPREVSDRYHEEFSNVFARFGFSYDYYGKTSDACHIAYVQEFHRALYRNRLIYEKTAPQAYCETCEKILTDRQLIGICPSCGAETRGDQCEACETVLDGELLLKSRCFTCGTLTVYRETKQLYIGLSKLGDFFRDYLRRHQNWRKNAQAFTRRYLEEGLRDRAVTRDLDWGIPVPYPGYQKKRIYIWAENVLGYLSASAVAAGKKGISFQELWGGDARHYFVHGKDNIPFHTIILPALLLLHGGELHLPDDIISSEYLTLEGKKISTSKNWAIWAKELCLRYHPDAFRYFFIANGPEKRDADFSWRSFAERCNSELLGAYGNLVNRTLAFIQRYEGGRIPNGVMEQETEEKITRLYAGTGELIEAGELKRALDMIFEFVRFGNRRFDAGEPWNTRKTDAEACRTTLFCCVQIVANLARLLHPFLPFSSERIENWLGIPEGWKPVWVTPGTRLPEISILFERISEKEVQEEEQKLWEKSGEANGRRANLA